MTTELYLIRDEIAALHEYSADLQMLESLANNLVYSLSTFQKSDDYYAIPPKAQQTINDTITDVLNTINKELAWTAEYDESEPEYYEWFKKTKLRILEDIEKLFE